MRATALIENQEREGFACEHGLAVYIEYRGKNYLLDAGTTGLCFENADKLGLSVEAVDMAFLSHAHYDHSGGLQTFFQRNQKAKLYLREDVLNYDYYKITPEIKKDIGFSKEILRAYRDRFVCVDGDIQVDEGVYLLGHHLPDRDGRAKRACLYQETGGICSVDDFHHEQTLVFETESGLAVLNSCCHSGVEHVVEEVMDVFPGQKIAAVIGGFHLMGVGGADTMAGDRKAITNLVHRLKELGDFKLYTGHCTGVPAYALLKEMLGDRIVYFSTGCAVEFL